MEGGRREPRDLLAYELRLEHTDPKTGDAEERENVSSATRRYLMAQNPHTTGPHSGHETSSAGFCLYFCLFTQHNLCLRFLDAYVAALGNLLQLITPLHPVRPKPFEPKTALLSVTILPPMALELYIVPVSPLAIHSGGFS